MDFVEIVFWGIVFLGPLVFFHELGHFLVAKACEVKILTFSLGFGPKLWSFFRGETEYTISALPLGGYVKMVGEGPESEIPPEDVPRAFSSKPVWQRAAIAFAGPLFNLILAFGVYVVMFSGEGTFGDTRVGVVMVDEPAWQAGLRPGDKLLAINGEELQHWNDVAPRIAPYAGETLTVTYARNGKTYETTVTPAARQQSNIFQETETQGKIGIAPFYVEPVVAAIDPKSPAALAGVQAGDRVLEVNGKKVGSWHEVRNLVHEAISKQEVIDEANHGAEATPEENDTAQGSKGVTGNQRVAKELNGAPAPAVQLRVERGDEDDKTTHTVSFSAAQPPEGVPTDLLSSADSEHAYTGLVSQESLIDTVDEDTPASRIGLKPGDRLVGLTIIKDGERVEHDIHSYSFDLEAFSGVDASSDFVITYQRGRDVMTSDLKLEAKEEVDEFKNKREVFVFGAKNLSSTVGTYTFTRHIGLVESIKEAGIQTAADATLIVKGLGKLLQGSVKPDSVGGPIMLFVIAEKSAKRGASDFFRVFAMISVNLGVLNLLPIPVLDGGHLLLFGIEAIRRRPPSPRTREVANMVGMVILLLLMAFVITNDFLKFVLG